MTKRTKIEMIQWRDDIVAVLQAGQPMTIRQLFYQCVVKGLVEKTENAYTTLSWEFARMRDDGDVPFDWIADFTRRIDEPMMFDDPSEALAWLSRIYKLNPWDEMDVQLQVWVEKEALSGIVGAITKQYRVPLIAVKGFPSLSVMKKMADHALARDKPLHVCQLGDWDPSGVLARTDARKRFLRLVEDQIDVEFHDVAVLEHHISQYKLPTRPTKTTSTHAKQWTGGDSVELDAFTTPQLQGFVRNFIEDHMDRWTFDDVLEREGREAQELKAITLEGKD